MHVDAVFPVKLVWKDKMPNLHVHRHPTLGKLKTARQYQHSHKRKDTSPPLASEKKILHRYFQFILDIPFQCLKSRTSTHAISDYWAFLFVPTHNNFTINTKKECQITTSVNFSIPGKRPEVQIGHKGCLPSLAKWYQCSSDETTFPMYYLLHHFHINPKAPDLSTNITFSTICPSSFNDQSGLATIRYSKNSNRWRQPMYSSNNTNKSSYPPQHGPTCQRENQYSVDILLGISCIFSPFTLHDSLLEANL